MLSNAAKPLGVNTLAPAVCEVKITCATRVSDPNIASTYVLSPCAGVPVGTHSLSPRFSFVNPGAPNPTAKSTHAANAPAKTRYGVVALARPSA